MCNFQAESKQFAMTLGMNAQIGKIQTRKVFYQSKCWE